MHFRNNKPLKSQKISHYVVIRIPDTPCKSHAKQIFTSLETRCLQNDFSNFFDVAYYDHGGMFGQETSSTVKKSKYSGGFNQF